MNLLKAFSMRSLTADTLSLWVKKGQREHYTKTYGPVNQGDTAKSYCCRDACSLTHNGQHFIK